MRKVQFKQRHAAHVQSAAESVGLERQISSKDVSKPRRVEHRTVMEGTDTDLAMLKLALFAHAERIGLDAPPMPIGGWPQLP